MIFKIFSPKNRRKNWRFLLKTKLNFEKIITLFFLEKRQFFRRKWAKIAENCDHNIDPWLIFTDRVRKETLYTPGATYVTAKRLSISYRVTLYLRDIGNEIA
jgi:hypothetical protein